MIPANPLTTIRQLAADEAKCIFYQPVMQELRRRGMDSDDLRDIIRFELAEQHCFRSEPTRKYYPETTSDYYSYWVDVCGEPMFIKLLVDGLGTRDAMLVVTSFKKDERHA